MNETLHQKLQRLSNESEEELRSIGLGDKLNKPISYIINFRAKQRLGQCCDKTSINISSWLLEIALDKDIKNTIIHEILHTFDDSIGHGARWQYYARYVNDRTEYNITRTTSVNDIYKRANISRPTKKYEITCKKCGATFYQARMTTRVLDSFCKGHRVHKSCGGNDFKIADLDKGVVLC